MVLRRVYSLETEYALSHYTLEETTLTSASVYDQLEAILLAQGDFAICDPTRSGNAADRELIEVREGFFLFHGARLYFDTEHLEWAAPESDSPTQAVKYDLAADRLLNAAIQTLNQQLPSGRVLLVKNNLDYHGASYGCHENYSIRLYSDANNDVKSQIIRRLVPFLVTRQLLCGAGRLGLNYAMRDGINTPPDEPIAYQLSQRAEFISRVTSVKTREERPLVNLRDEPLADGNRYARLHLIVGDSNLAQVSNFLKLGITGLLLDMIESEAALPEFELSDPVSAIKKVSGDLTFLRPLDLEDGGTITPLDVQMAYFNAAVEFVNKSSAHHSPEALHIIDQWNDALEMLRTRSDRMYQSFDWAIKYRLLDRLVQKLGTDWDTVGKWDYVLAATERVSPPDDGDWGKWIQQQVTPYLWTTLKTYLGDYQLHWDDLPQQRVIANRLRMFDIRFHELDVNYGFFQQLGDIYTVVEDGAVDIAMREPPNTRARVRTHAMIMAREMRKSIRMDWHRIHSDKDNVEIQLLEPLANDLAALKPLFSLAAKSTPPPRSGVLAGAPAAHPTKRSWLADLFQKKNSAQETQPVADSYNDDKDHDDDLDAVRDNLADDDQDDVVIEVIPPDDDAQNNEIQI